MVTVIRPPSKVVSKASDEWCFGVRFLPVVSGL